MDYTVQKLKGQVQQIQGEIKQRTGDTLGGAMDKIEGKAKEDIANLQLKAEDHMDQEKHYDDHRDNR